MIAPSLRWAETTTTETVPQLEETQGMVQEEMPTLDQVQAQAPKMGEAVGQRTEETGGVGGTGQPSNTGHGTSGMRDNDGRDL